MKIPVHRLQRRLLHLVLLMVAWTASASAGNVTTRDGRTRSGSIRIDGTDLVLTPSDGADLREARIPLSEVVQATFSQAKTAVITNANLPAPVRPAARKPTRKAAGGIKAEYFSDEGMKNPCLARREDNLLYAWPAGDVRDPQVPDQFTARWTGRFTMPRYEQATTRTLYLEFDGAVRFWLDGKLETDNWADRPRGTRAEFPLEAGRPHDFRLEYRHDGGEGHAQFLMTTIDAQSRRALKGWYFAPPTDDTNAPPEVEVVTPAEAEVHVGPAEILVEAKAADSDGLVKRVRLYDNGQLIKEIDRAPYRAAISTPAAGVHRLTAQAIDDRGLSAMSEPVKAYVATALPESDPAPANGLKAAEPWAAVFLPPMPVPPLPPPKHGVVDPAALKAIAKPMPEPNESRLHRVDSADGKIVLVHAGGELTGDSDSFACVYREIAGDFELIARVASVECADPEAQPLAGLMIQGDFRHESARTSLLVRSTATGREAVQLSRARPGLPEWSQAKVQMPAWLRVIRAGRQIRTFTSPDGEHWAPVGTAQTGLPDHVFAGLTACTRDGRVPVTATFDHLKLIPWQEAFASRAAGILLSDGTFLDESLVHLASAEMDAQSLRVRLPGRTQPVPIRRDQVARILYGSVREEATRALPAGTTGALMANGDTVEGTVDSLTGGQVTVTSVLFGRRSFRPKQDVTAILLQDAPATGAFPADAAFVVSTATDSRIVVKSLRAERDDLLVDELELGIVRIRQASVLDIRAAGK